MLSPSSTNLLFVTCFMRNVSATRAKSFIRGSRCTLTQERMVPTTILALRAASDCCSGLAPGAGATHSGAGFVDL